MSTCVLKINDLSIIENNHNTYYKQGINNIGKQSALVGISPGNSFFNRENMLSVLAGLCKLSPQVFVIIPDAIHVHNYCGSGYPLEIARKKARAENSRVHKRLKDVCYILQNELKITNYRILDWQSNFEENSAYQDNLQTILTDYDNNKAFQQCINDHSFQYLYCRAKSRTVISFNISQAVLYYLKELALISSLKSIFYENFIVSYHKIWDQGFEYLEKLFPKLTSEISLIQYQVLKH